MKRAIILIVSAVVLMILIDSCYRDKVDTLYPLAGYASPCDSASTYNLSIKYIMVYNCTSCHNANNPFAGVALDTYSSVVQQAKNGNLMGTILSQPGHSSMPPGGVQLSSCQIDKLNQWINAQEPQ